MRLTRLFEHDTYDLSPNINIAMNFGINGFSELIGLLFIFNESLSTINGRDCAKSAKREQVRVQV